MMSSSIYTAVEGVLTHTQMPHSHDLKLLSLHKSVLELEKMVHV